MTLYQAEYRSRARREKTKEAITLAMQSRWQEAVAVNREIIGMFPNDVDAFNRLGKAYLELGSYDDALSAFSRALQLSPSNAIARKNLGRIEVLRRGSHQPKATRTVRPQHFLEESGKSGTAVLEHTVARDVVAKLTAGEPVDLVPSGRRMVVTTPEGDYLGQLPPRLAGRLLRLMHGGNIYEAVITHLQRGEITVLIREAYQHPSQRGTSLFPSRAEQTHAYVPEPIHDMEALEDEDEEIEAAFNAEWEENGEEAALYSRRGRKREVSAGGENEAAV